MKVLELREKQGRLAETLRDIVRNAENEKREGLTPEERGKFDEISKELSDLKGDILRAKQVEDLQAKHAEEKAEKEERTGKETPSKVDAEKRYEKTFNKYLRHGARGLNSEEINLMSNKISHVRGTGPQTTTVTAGGYTIPEGFSNQLETSLLFTGPMLTDLVQLFRTSSGNQIPWPTVDDTSVVGAILNEDTPSVPVSDMSFGQKLLNAYTYHSNVVKVSVPLMEDSAFDLGTFLADQLGQRLGRIINQHLTIGTGSGQPNGFVTALNAASRTVNAADDVTVARTDLVNLIYGVNRAYRNQNAAFQMNDATISKYRILGFGSADDRPLYLQGDATKGEPDMLEGYKVVVNNDMASIAADARTVAFGDWKKYVTRVVNDITLVRMDERFMDSLQVGFIAYMRADGECINTSALALLRQSNT